MARTKKAASKQRNEYKQSAEYKAKRAKAIKVGTAAAGTALAAYGAHKLSKYLKSEAGKRSYEDGKYFIDEYIKTAGEYTDMGRHDAASWWYDEARRVGRDTDKRSRIVRSSTIDAVRYLRNPDDERWQVYKR